MNKCKWVPKNTLTCILNTRWRKITLMKINSFYSKLKKSYPGIHKFTIILLRLPFYCSKIMVNPKKSCKAFVNFHLSERKCTRGTGTIYNRDAFP